MEPVKEFIAKVRWAELAIRRCERKIEEINAACTKSTTSWSAVSGGGGGDCHKDAKMIALIEKKEELEKLAEDKAAAETEVHAFLDQMPDCRQREVLWLRYAEGCSWFEVQSEMEKDGLPYSIRHIHNLHGNGLQIARKLWEARE